MIWKEEWKIGKIKKERNVVERRYRKIRESIVVEKKSIIKKGSLSSKFEIEKDKLGNVKEKKWG